MRSACFIALVTLVACGDSPEATPTDGGATDAGTEASVDGAPTIDGGGCQQIDDTPCILHGAGFGDNVLDDQLWLGGKTGVIETAAVGTDMAASPRWVSDTAGNGVTQVASAKAWSYGKAIMCDSATAPKGTNGNGPWQGIFSAAYDTSKHIKRLTLHYKVLWEDQSVALGQAPLKQMQWKMVRLGYSAGVSDGDVPNMLLSDWIGQSTLSRNAGDHGTSWLPEANMPRINGGWYTVELEVQVNAPLSAANGTYRVRVRRMSDGVVTANESATNIQYIAPNDPNGFFQWIVFQNYQGNLNQGFGAEPSTNPSRVFLDDVYVVSGGKGAYVVLGDAPNWADVKHEEVQPFSTWTDTAIHIPKLNQGGFTNLANKWFYVKTGPATVMREQGMAL